MSDAAATGPSVRTAAVWGMAGQYVAFFAQFVTSVVISRFFLTPGEVGLFGTALAAAMMVAIFQDFGISRYVAGEPDLDDDKLRRCFSVSIVFALGIGGLILALAWPTARFYDDMRLFPILAVIAGSYLLVPFYVVPSALLQRRLDFRGLFFVNAGAALAMMAVTIGLAANGWSAMSLAIGAVAQNLARAVIGQWASGAHPRLPLSLADTGPILKFGSQSSGLALSGALGMRSPELIVGRLLGFAAVGLYGRAVSLSGQLRLLVSGAIGGVFFPAFARMRDRGEPFAPAYIRVVSAYSVTTWPAMAFLAAASVPVVSILYGPVWAGVAPILMLVAISEIAFTALPLHMDIPVVLGRMRSLLYRNLIDTGFSIVLLVVAALVSIEWAAASRIAYGIAWYGVYAGFMHRLIGFRWRDIVLVYVRSLACTLATVAPILLAYALGLRPADTGFAALAAMALAGCLCWALMLFVVRHPARLEFLDMASGAMSRLRARVA
ncbi:lipopolysaccharide biosynthesis protein [Sphingomonas sp. SUN039]|uniref:lipopolysaccharide biosynthesis protein n=1 Tax=Sphingomonas sp. SUN039 TaxID=2937787 RepID=UPI00216474A5|nr:lipopolysaccharide biosynthesis protein [Sphingomonas sp. SUN039]UVO52798.1 lipopolysaccharide biosynthesis protein [Sphingomonas sp. SUN039]